MDGFIIEYLSDVLITIKFVSSFISLFIITMLILAIMIQDDIAKQIISFANKYKAILIILCLFAIFLPQGLKYSYVNQYIEENGQLRKQLNQMDYLIQKYELQQQLLELQK